MSPGGVDCARRCVTIGRYWDTIVQVQEPRSDNIRVEAAQIIGAILSEDGQTPAGGPTEDPGPFGEILNLGLPDATDPAVIPSAPTVTAAPTYEPSAPKTHRRSLIIGVIGAVVVVALAIAAIFIVSATSAAISAGSGTATISWVPTAGSGDTSGIPPQSFAGSIGGNSLSGVATTVLPPGGTNPFGTTTGDSQYIQVFRYTGSFAGKPFNIGISFKAPLSLSASSKTSLFVNGTYNGQAVHAVVGAPSNPNQASPSVPFSGTIGKWQVSGIIHCCSATNNERSATASYTVSS